MNTSSGYSSSAHRAWIFLVLATVITWTLGDQGQGGWAICLLVLGLALFKGLLVILDFMELRHAPRLWQLLVGGWLTLVLLLILITYHLGTP